MAFVASQTVAVSISVAGSGGAQTFPIPGAFVDASNSGIASTNGYKHVRMDNFLTSSGLASISFNTTPASQTVTISSAANSQIVVAIPWGATTITITGGQTGTVLLHFGRDWGG